LFLEDCDLWRFMCLEQIRAACTIAHVAIVM
jgi:hypothetical protein